MTTTFDVTMNNILMSRLDVCESKVEVTTPFWASNSNGKVMMMIR